MKIRWLIDRYKPIGFVEDVPDDKGKFWVDRGMVEEVKPKAKVVKAAPKDKVVGGSTDK